MHAISIDSHQNTDGIRELNNDEVISISGGLPIIAVTAGILALGGSALDLGYKLGGMLYKATH